ncbi:MAG TPA: glycosyltransferase [bacterium]|nr:glycosyltransferase [bacterium]HPN81662.1 glycosyltransferase [bacterium]HPW39842.1 glycosyltransferase [bacterium]
MKVCYFGIYRSNYSRNRTLIKGLKDNGIEIIECRTDCRGLAKYIDLFKQYWPLRKAYDVMMVGFPGQQAMILARLLTRRPIFFNAFVSLYDSMVLDRQELSPRSFKARYFWFLDWLSCRLASMIILDTDAHIDYFVRTFHLEKEKFLRVWVGSDDRELFPVESKKNSDDFMVHFHGSMVPLQGVNYILKAAKLLESKNIKFNIIGSKIKKLAPVGQYPNVNFIDDVPYEELRDYMARADVCLGVFGASDKTKRIIPNKVFEAIACARPVITGDSPAVRELFTDGENIALCRLADSESLAAKILALESNALLRQKIADNAFVLFQSRLKPAKLVEGLIFNIEKYAR